MSPFFSDGNRDFVLAAAFIEIRFPIEERSGVLLLLLLLFVGPAESHLAHCSLPRLIVIKVRFNFPFISRGAPRQTA
jgi:hypothetical protein